TLWETETGRLLWTLDKQASGIAGVALSPDGQQLAVASGQSAGKLVVWDVAQRRPHRTLPVSTGLLWCVAFRPDGKTLAGGGGRWWGEREGKDWLQLWDGGRGKERHLLKGHSEPVVAVGFSPDSTILGSTSWDGTAKLWDSATGRELRTLKGHGNRV